MELDEECKGCLYNSQLKKVEREQKDGKKLSEFKAGVKALCENPPEHYCAPLLMRDIDSLHREIFGAGIDYSREKSLFNLKLLSMEEELYSHIMSSADSVESALGFACASNYIDFARLCDIGEDSVSTVIEAGERSKLNKAVTQSFKEKLKSAGTLCFLHDNCGEIVLDKILIRVISHFYPRIRITSVVRGKPIINDVTKDDAKEVGLEKYSRVADNGTGIPGTCLAEISEEVKQLLKHSDVIISKGLGNLETLYGEGYNVFYAFNCKCRHIAERFSAPLWSSVFVEEK